METRVGDAQAPAQPAPEGPSAAFEAAGYTALTQPQMLAASIRPALFADWGRTRKRRPIPTISEGDDLTGAWGGGMSIADAQWWEDGV